jgi:hypothetical protein
MPELAAHQTKALRALGVHLDRLLP